MSKATTSRPTDNTAPSTPEETQAAADYKQKLQAEIAQEMGEEADAQKTEGSEPASEKNEQEESISPVQEEESEEKPSSGTEPLSNVTENEKLSPKELRYKQQLEGEKKSNQELLAKLQALEEKVSSISSSSQQPNQELTAEEQQTLEEKKYLKEKYGVATREDYEALEQKMQSLVEQYAAPIKQKRQQEILDGIYTSFPDLKPESDPSNEKWEKVQGFLRRFTPADLVDPLKDYPERFSWAYERAFGAKPKVNHAQMKQNSYAGVGGGVSAAKSKTTESDDKYAHFSPEMRAYKIALEKGIEDDFRRNEKR